MSLSLYECLKITWAIIFTVYTVVANFYNKDKDIQNEKIRNLENRVSEVEKELLKRINDQKFETTMAKIENSYISLEKRNPKFKN